MSDPDLNNATAVFPELFSSPVTFSFCSQRKLIRSDSRYPFPLTSGDYVLTKYPHGDIFSGIDGPR